jgi:hypothetical protein
MPEGHAQVTMTGVGGPASGEEGGCTAGFSQIAPCGPSPGRAFSGAGRLLSSDTPLGFCQQDGITGSIEDII